jgi:hypothetical protein
MVSRRPRRLLRLTGRPRIAPSFCPLPDCFRETVRGVVPISEPAVTPSFDLDGIPQVLEGADITNDRAARATDGVGEFLATAPRAVEEPH